MNRGLGIVALVVVVLVGGAVAALGFRVSPQPAESAAAEAQEAQRGRAPDAAGGARGSSRATA